MKTPAGRNVFRYPLELTGEQFVHMPRGAQVLLVDYQVRAPHGLCIWALVDPEAEEEPRRIVITGTGHSAPVGAEHLGSVQSDTGYVWHVWHVWNAP